jgi:hypothetical protein
LNLKHKIEDACRDLAIHSAHPNLVQLKEDIAEHGFRRSPFRWTVAGMCLRDLRSGS